MTKIAMWSGPRSISTALMRSFENRPDTFVSDEPFYASYLHETKIEHPFHEEVIAKGNTNWNSVSNEITGPIPKGKNIWYQKHMAQHNLPGKDLKWIWKMDNILLIRHPKEVILSYIKKYELLSISQIGYSQTIEIFNMLKDGGKSPLILDTRDILENPYGLLKGLCNRLDIPFYKEMLSWPKGKRETDGIWRKHWYGNVEKSTGFHPYTENDDSLPDKYEGLFTECMDSYQQLYQHRLKVTCQK